jgi:hypothetical protein
LQALSTRVASPVDLHSPAWVRPREQGLPARRPLLQLRLLTGEKSQVVDGKILVIPSARV